MGLSRTVPDWLSRRTAFAELKSLAVVGVKALLLVLVPMVVGFGLAFGVYMGIAMGAQQFGPIHTKSTVEWCR